MHLYAPAQSFKWQTSARGPKIVSSWHAHSWLRDDNVELGRGFVAIFTVLSRGGGLTPDKCPPLSFGEMSLFRQKITGIRHSPVVTSFRHYSFEIVSRCRAK